VNDPADRFIALILGAGWILSGAGQQLTFMRDLDFLAVWYAAGLIVQGVLLAVVGGALGRLHWRFASDRLGHVGAALAVAGLLLHPVAILATGREPSAVPLAGTTPDATAIVTAGLLLAVRSAPPLFLFVIPLAWAGVAAVSGYLLGFWPDYLVAAAVAIALAVTIRQRFFLLR
jgi:hypothetical protein